jgi:hypothetical protein
MSDLGKYAADGSAVLPGSYVGFSSGDGEEIPMSVAKDLQDQIDAVNAALADRARVRNGQLTAADGETPLQILGGEPVFDGDGNLVDVIIRQPVEES